jgi:NADH-quinone oxidoreductase subunit J
MSLQNLFFIIFCGITLGGALMAVLSPNVLHNAFFLILSLFGMAALFIFLNSEFLAVMQVIIYIGAISVAILFAIMLSENLFKKGEKYSNRIPQSLVASLLLLAALAQTFTRTKWPIQTVNGDYSIRALGKSLLTTYALPFEAVSVVLLVAIIGALVLAAEKKEGA